MIIGNERRSSCKKVEITSRLKCDCIFKHCKSIVALSCLVSMKRWNTLLKSLSKFCKIFRVCLTILWTPGIIGLNVSWQRSLSYRNQSRYLRHETVKYEFWTYFLLHQCWGKKGFIKNVFFLFNVRLYCNNRNSSNIIVLREVLGAAWKVTKYGFISAPSFPLFGFNTEIYSVNLRIQSEYRKINNPIIQ